MLKSTQKYMVTFVNNKTNKSGLKKLVVIKNNEKDMIFLDSGNDVLYVDEVLPIGTIKDVEQTILK